MMEDLYRSEAWQKATSLQRTEFVSKIRADKRIKEDAAKAKAKKEKKLAKQQNGGPKPLTRRQKRLAKVREARKKKLEQIASKANYKVEGTDVRSDAFLQTYAWRKLRMEALKNYGPKCMCCGATPAHGAVMNVDHIKPRKEYPELALVLNNLQILCHPCNHGKGNWDKTDWRPK